MSLQAEQVTAGRNVHVTLHPLYCPTRLWELGPDGFNDSEAIIGIHQK